MPFVPTDAFPVDLLPSGQVRPLVAVRWTGYQGDEAEVPAGRISDLGTVPRLVRAVLPHDGPAARAFLVHDELLRLIYAYQEALDAWARSFRSQLNEPIPEPPAFDSVDADAVMRVILAELGVGPVRWIYWEGVRLAALGSRARRRGWMRPRSVLPFLALALPSLLVVLPAAVGALISWALLGVVRLLCAPWERKAARKRTRAVNRVLARVDHDEKAAIVRWDAAGDEVARLEEGAARVLVSAIDAGTETRELRESATRTGDTGVRRATVAGCTLCGFPHARGGLHHTPESWLRLQDAVTRPAPADPTDHPALRPWSPWWRRALRQIARPFRAIGRGVANVLHALLEAL